MFMISKEAMNSLISLRDKMADSRKKSECVVALENMIRAKESHLARAEWSSCCGNICNLVPQLDTELRMLQNILEVLRKGDSNKAAFLLDDYIAFLQKSYSLEPD